MRVSSSLHKCPPHPCVDSQSSDLLVSAAQQLTMIPQSYAPDPRSSPLQACGSEASGRLAFTWPIRESISRPASPLTSNITRTCIPIPRPPYSHILLQTPSMCRTSTMEALLVPPRRLCRLPRPYLKTSTGGGTYSLRGPAICGLK